MDVPEANAAAGMIRIHVDMRERGSSVPTFLGAYPDVELRFGALPSGDYVLAEEVAVERKTAADFVASILDRRLFGQAARLKVLFPRAIILIEGDLAAVPHSIDQEAVRGALAFLVVREGVTVLHSAGAEASAALLRLMARHAQQRAGQPVSLREPKPLVEELYAAYLVEGLPGVGPRRARLLLSHFGTPAAVMCAAAEELARVPGIGRKSAERIWRATHVASAGQAVAAPAAPGGQMGELPAIAEGK
jgi:ERCC4-type nuclease